MPCRTQRWCNSEFAGVVCWPFVERMVDSLQEDEVGEKEPSRPSETIEEPTVEKNAVVEPSADEVPSQVTATATAAPDSVPTEASTSAASVAVPGST